ncbi:MAG: seryl-tRNA synthetase [Solirubrobacteraceae bacterium]|nr:seryl-tRNA synthetase [Solirubrobacteraceae bacterium]
MICRAPAHTRPRNQPSKGSAVLDLKLIRREPEAVRKALARRGAQAGLDRVLELDERWRALTQQLEDLQAERNKATRGRRGPPSPEEHAQESELAERGRALSDEHKAAEDELNAALAALPNLPDADAPLEEQVLKEVGEAGRGGRDHLELAGDLIDMDAAARLSGSRFAYLTGDLVLLEFALVRFALDKAREHGFEPVVPPVLVREPALYGTGFLPDTEQQIYRLADDDLYLVGTSEVSLASLHAGEILEEDQLPLRYVGFSTCFRREAGAAGKDTRGIFRVHQFDKVEMFSFVVPETSGEEHELILSIEEEIMQEFEIPYRVVAIAVDDLGASAAKKYDVEAWLPGQQRYREVTSCSNTTDYQARRLNIRCRPKDGRPRFVHTLNGTAVAVGRMLIALLENGQRDDGTVGLPQRLVEYGAPAVIGATVAD